MKESTVLVPLDIIASVYGAQTRDDIRIALKYGENYREMINLMIGG